MGFLHHITAQTTFSLNNLTPFFVDTDVVGWLTPQIASTLQGYSQYVQPYKTGLQLNLNVQGFDARSILFDELIDQLVSTDELPSSPYLNNEYQRVGPDRETNPLFKMKRFYAVFFGIEVDGVALNAYEGHNIWLSQRGAHMLSHPSKLDCLAGGCCSAEFGLLANMHKEAVEEAALSPEWLAKIKPVSKIQLCYHTPHGYLWREKIHCFDLATDTSFVPSSHMTEEVESFKLTNISDVLQWLESADVFKPNIALVLIDFYIRHGYITPDHPSYDATLNALRPNMKALETCP